MSNPGNLRLAFIIDAIDNATAKVRAVMRELGKSFDPLRRMRAAQRDLLQEGGGWDRFKEQMEKVNQRGMAVAETVSTITVGFAALTAAAGATFFAIKRTIDEVDRTGDIAKKLGMPIETLQRMGYAAQLNGSSADEMATSLQFLSQNMIEAVNGSKETALWFARAGIPLAQLKNMKVDQVFEAIADKFSKVGNAGQNAEKKIALMRALMGRGGAELRQVLDLGSEGLRKFYDEADRLGAVIDGPTAEAMAGFNDNFDRLKFSIFGVVASIAKYALPQLDAMVKRFTDMNVASRADWGERLGKMVGELVLRLPSFLTSVGQITSALAGLAMGADGVAQALGGWDVVLNGIAAVMAGVLIAKVVVFGFSLWALMPALKVVTALVWAMSLPFLPVIAGMAALGAAAVLLWKYWEPLKQFFDDIGESITSAGSAAAWVAGLIGRAVSAVSSGLMDGLRFLGTHTTTGAPGQSIVSPLFGSGPAVPTANSGRGALQAGGTLKVELGDGLRSRSVEKAPGSFMDFDVYAGQSLPGY